MTNSELNTIDFSQNSALTSASFFETELNSLNFSANPLLVSLHAQISFIDSVNLTSNPMLKTLNLSRNILEHIDLSQNTELVQLWLSENNLSSINLSNNDSLSDLWISSNQLYELDISANSKLRWLFCDTNQIEILDLRFNPLLEYLYCNNNNLTELNIQNGNNSIIPNFGYNSENNTNLICIQVDNVNYSNATWTSKDVQSFYNIDCFYDLGFDAFTDMSINYYPNPTKSVLNINITTLNEALTLEIFSADGRLIKTISLQDQNNQLDVSELASGNYMASVKSKNGNQSQFMFVKE